MRNKAIIESLMCLLKYYKAVSDKVNKDSLHYLIGQTIRQYDIPKDNRHISQAAQQLWDKLTTGNISDYHYRNLVTCDKLTEPVSLCVFSGAEKNGKPKEFKKGDKFIFRELFHEDHVIPVSLILKELAINTPVNYADIENVLNKMHLCVVLKKEDKKLGRTAGRTLSFKDTIDNVYKKNNIILNV